ncbi:NAD(P)H-dependent glycerol-3-phosphate dehydrogenase [Desmospora activa]|uniref:Glycerol-3-phosphate dehydrogenase [NAD(P)+] n=1 Tax=Desmospora activa DSM 45169 TaxID=1121389 RepID=A0A2T4Z9U8_9BACL|nr:NAD(P)H-dependent glycerol-3-phosphate dehydrogenase [Desmospora activa]PTM58668.1 glycerol 3-phosphate dehydrogenase (NAD(P)+) [Desmospora activa DSM 45169]
MKKRTTVLGAGSWGTVLAAVLAENGHAVTLWARSHRIAEEINQNRTNQRYLQDTKLPDGIQATTDITKALDGAQLVLMVVPSQAVRETAEKAAPHIPADALLVHASKGFERSTLKRISEVLEEECHHHRGRVAVLSGPSHAEEVIRRSPTTVVVASKDERTAKAVQSFLNNQSFRVYTHSDVIGVEVGGSLKNIIALGAGLSDGLGFGDNAKAALITRGLAEMARLGMAMGAEPITFAGLSGVGDLVVTCTSRHSRNWRAGNLLSQGHTLQQVLDQMGMVVEGVKTTQAAYDLSNRYGVEMPITNQLYAVLFQDKDPRQAVEDLMARGETDEWNDMVQKSPLP